jgi:hypothetical protein
VTADHPALVSPVLAEGLEIGDERLDVERPVGRGAAAAPLVVEMDAGEVVDHRGDGIEVVREAGAAVGEDEWRTFA